MTNVTTDSVGIDCYAIQQVIYVVLNCEKGRFVQDYSIILIALPPQTRTAIIMRAVGDYLGLLLTRCVQSTECASGNCRSTLLRRRSSSHGRHHSSVCGVVADTAGVRSVAQVDVTGFSPGRAPGIPHNPIRVGGIVAVQPRHLHAVVDALIAVAHYARHIRGPRGGRETHGQRTRR